MKNGKRLFRLAGAALAASGLMFLENGCQFDTDLPPGEKSDLTVDELVKKMDKAMDPDGNFRKAKSYVLKQKVLDTSKFELNEYSLEIKYKAPELMKFSSIRAGKPFSTLIFDGTKAWNINPETKLATEISKGKGMNLVKTFAALTRPGSTVKTVFKSVDIDMIKDEFEVLCYRLVCRVEDSSIAPYVILVGPDYLTRSIETVLYSDDGTEAKYHSHTIDYAWISGIKMSKESIVEVGDRKVKYSMVSFTLNPEIPDSDFKVPEPWNAKDPVPAEKAKE